MPAEYLARFYDSLKAAFTKTLEDHNLPVPPIMVSGDEIDAKVISVVDLLGLIGDTAEET